LLSPDGVTPSQMVDVSAPCTIKSRSFLLAPARPGGSGKRAVKRLWCGNNHISSAEVFRFRLCLGDRIVSRRRRHSEAIVG